MPTNPCETTTIETTLPCGERAARALAQRVASVRAALDAVRGALPLQDALQAPLAGATFELERLARDVRALIDWSLPSPLRPLECSLEEIGFAAVDALRPDQRGRTQLAVEQPTTRAHVDGPLASKSLARLLEHGYACGADRADLRIEPRESGFAAIASFTAGTLRASGEASVADGLAEALARRDLARLGARVELESGLASSPRRSIVAFECAAATAGGSR